jgi:hypothetical protein
MTEYRNLDDQVIMNEIPLSLNDIYRDTENLPVE